MITLESRNAGTMARDLRTHVTNMNLINTVTLEPSGNLFPIPAMLNIRNSNERVPFVTTASPLDLIPTNPRPDPFVGLFEGLWALSSYAGPGEVPGSGHIWREAVYTMHTQLARETIYNGEGLWISGADRLQVCVQSNGDALSMHVNSALYFNVLSILHEYMSVLYGLELGDYTIAIPWVHLPVKAADPARSPYDTKVTPMSLVRTQQEIHQFQEDLSAFLFAPKAMGYRTPFINKVARPMYVLWEAIQQGEPEYVQQAKNQLLVDNDWTYAAKLWFSLQS